MGIAELQDRLFALQALPPPPDRREIREAAGVSLGAVAQALGVSRTAVFHWESGERNPSPEHLPDYLKALAMLSRFGSKPSQYEVEAGLSRAGLEGRAVTALDAPL